MTDQAESKRPLVPLFSTGAVGVLIRLHPGAAAQRGRVGHGRTSAIHLRQGSIANSSGVLASLMALVALGLLTPAQARGLSLVEDGDRLAPLWQQARELFLLGADTEDLLALLSSMGKPINCEANEGPTRTALTFALDQLEGGALVIVGLGPNRVAVTDWVLAVGTRFQGSGSKRQATALLCLDPALPPLALVPYNAQLELNLPRKGARLLHYRQEAGGMPLVAVGAAIAVRRRT